MIDLKIGNKDVTAKFNFKALLEANKKYSGVDNDGNSMEDGAATLLIRLANDDTTALVDILKVTVDGKFNDDQFIEAVEVMTDDGENLDEVMAEFKEELKNSGFFKKAIHAQIKQLEDMMPMLENKAETDTEFKDGLMAVQQRVKLLKENI